MSSITPARPSRRAAASRRTKKVVESSGSEAESEAPVKEGDYEEAEEEEDEDETPPPRPTPRRKSRRITSTPAPAVAPPRTTRARRTRSGAEPEAPSSAAPKPRAARTSRKKAPPKLKTPEIKGDSDEEDVLDKEQVPERKDTPMQGDAPMEGDTPMQGDTPMRECPMEEPTVQKLTPGPSATPAQLLSQALGPTGQLRTPSPTPSGRPTPAVAPPLEQSQLEATPNTPIKPLEEMVTSSMAGGEAVTPRPTSSYSNSSQNPPVVVKSRANALFQQQQLEQEQGPKPRLVITHLVLMNFKSYAGRQEVGPFHASFSSVVGPNGSGKSNVIDSLLFVFGFRASKMRQGKISALIHNSAAFPSLDYCEVEVHFQEVLDAAGGGHEVVPDSKLVVSRRAFKNNSSKYYINGGTSDYTQVTTLLRGRGIDLDHKRFLILQGEVESIAQMKPKAQHDSDDGLLEYLEDIIGTSKYKQPIEESATQVEELNEICVEKSTRVQHVEKEKNSLEDKKEAALEFIRNENELTTRKSALYQIHIADSTANINVTAEMTTQLQAQLDEELEKHRGNEDEIKKLERKYKAGSKEVEEVEAATKAILKELAKSEKENVKFQEKEKFLTQKQKKLQKTIQTNRLAASEAAATIEKHAQDLERFGKQITTLETNLGAEEQELDRIRDTLKEKTQGFSDQIAVKQKTLEPWKEKINEKQSAIAVAQSELDILYEKNNASQNAMEEAQSKIAVIDESRAVKERELKDCQKEITKLSKQGQKVQTELEKINQKEPQLRSNVSGARQKADEAKASLAATQTQGNVLTGLMRLKESGRIEGFHGRLGNLGTIDARYDVAISTACPQLDNMVVDSVEAGQQCIDYLRKNNLGRANFICLDKLHSRNLNTIETPENVPRLFDLVKPKGPVLAPAFYSVLQDTLVAGDLAQANRIAYGAKRWRVVTLEGQLIDKSGTMTGGGQTVSKGRMSSKLVADTSKEAVAKLETDRDTQERIFQEFQQQRSELESTLRDIKGRIPEAEVMISKIVLEIEAGNKQRTDLEKRIRELSAQGKTSKVDDRQVSVLESRIKQLGQEIGGLNSETAEIEKEIKSLQNLIMEVGGIKLRSQKSKVDGIREQLETLNEQLSNADMARTKAEKGRIKAEKAFNGSTRELENVAVELEGLHEEIQDHAKLAEADNAKAEEAQTYLEEKSEELAAVKEELDEKLGQLNKTRAAEIEMKNKLEEHQKALVDNQKRLRHWEQELSKLELQSVSDGAEATEDLSLPEYTEDELADMDKAQLNGEIAALEEKLQNVNVDMAVLAEYRKRVEDYQKRSKDLEESVIARDSAKQRIDDLRKRRLEEFMEGFSAISLRLKEMYQMITMGGNAELELVDSLDPFSEGILFSVMPPKKSWKNISNLSGGEKTLSSLALVFALHHYKPTPLYVMDEIDAALDFRNVSIVASYIKERTKNAQFIVISLRNNMFELAARLVGVYKVNHMTKSVTIENQDYIEKH